MITHLESDPKAQEGLVQMQRERDLKESIHHRQIKFGNIDKKIYKFQVAFTGKEGNVNELLDGQGQEHVVG